MSVSTADLCDDYIDELSVAEPLFRSFGALPSFQGPALTLRVRDDNVLVRRELEGEGEGRVLVVDGGGSLRCALMGDLLAALAVENGWAGALIYGSIRDSAQIATMPIGIRALSTCPRKSAKEGKGERNIEVSFAGVRISPGDYVYADDDGIVVAGRNLLAS